jgi:hypothetical protein
VPAKLVDDLGKLGDMARQRDDLELSVVRAACEPVAWSTAARIEDRTAIGRVAATQT